ncbi:MAG: hypothetical protein ACJ8C4_10400 [Gemmataceae bacterium]
MKWPFLRARGAHQSILRRSSLRVCQLEDRLAPASLISPISVAEPTLSSDSGSGQSYIANDPQQTAQILTRTISDDGRYIAFTSKAANLIAGQSDSNGDCDVFVHDYVTNTTELISHKSNSTVAAGNGGSSAVTISPDGRYVVYRSFARDLIAGMVAPANSGSNVFLYDRSDGSCRLVSHSAGDVLTGASYDVESGNVLAPEISADGHVITFISQATNLVTGFPNPGGSSSTTLAHAYVYDVPTSQVTLVDRANGSASTPGNGNAIINSLSSDSRYMLLSSTATNLLASPTTSQRNVYRYDRQTGALVLLTQNNSGTTPLGGNAKSFSGAISADGRWALVQSSATNLLGGTTTAGNQIYLCDVQTGTLTLVAHASGAPTTGGNGSSLTPAMSSDGRYISFRSLANNLVSNYVNGHSTSAYDVYFYDRVTNQVNLLNHQSTSITTSSNGGSIATWPPKISSDGRYVAFFDLGTNLVNGFVDQNGLAFGDLYRYDRDTGAVRL